MKEFRSVRKCIHTSGMCREEKEIIIMKRRKMSSARHRRKEQADYVKALLELSHLTNTGNILRKKMLRQAY